VIRRVWCALRRDVCEHVGAAIYSTAATGVLLAIGHRAHVPIWESLFAGAFLYGVVCR
jgi:hypothetical protein